MDKYNELLRELLVFMENLAELEKEWSKLSNQILDATGCTPDNIADVKRIDSTFGRLGYESRERYKTIDKKLDGE